MQVKLWDKNKEALQGIIKEPEYKSLKISVARVANMAIENYISGRTALKKKSK